jgi:hypothetical protein
MNIKRLSLVLSGCFAFAFSFAKIGKADEGMRFEPQDLPVTLQVGYAVRAVDMNNDQKVDVAIVDSKRVLWLENPTWAEHVIYETPEVKFDNVCFAPFDVNRDGLVDLALGSDWQFNNSDSGGDIGWLEHTKQGPWKYHLIAHEPTTHRMQWVDWLNNGKPELVVAPLKGKGSRPPGFDQVGIRLLSFTIPNKPAEEAWPSRVLTDKLHVMHNFDSVDMDNEGLRELITASYEGVTWVQSMPSDPESKLTRLGSGQEQPAPARGASEIRLGRLAGEREFIATIEPWHGDKVVVYVSPTAEWQSTLWPRFVLDEQLAWGHAVATANLDGDADEELIIGVRDNQSDEHRHGVRVYDPIDGPAGKWKRLLIDPGGVAVEDLVTADFDQDGLVDIVAVGRATHNAKIYWNRSQRDNK